MDAVSPAQRVLELKEEGNDLFRRGEMELAKAKYTTALAVEERSVLFANRAACHAKLGSHDDVITDCTRALELDETYVKALVRRAAAYEALDKLDAAIADLERAGKNTDRLTRKRHHRDQDLKDEAVGKLKDLGNSLLGNFGLSLDNFQVQEGEGGGYSISYNP